ncbi:MAG: ZIP family metal transporter [bacterium]
MGLLLAYSLGTTAVFLGGAAALAVGKGWARRNSVYLTSFAAGILLSLSFLHLAPEALEGSRLSPVFVLAGFFVLYVIEYTVMPHEHVETTHGDFIVYALVAGMMIHAFTDGVVVGIGFLGGERTGVITAVAVLAHKFPVGFAVATIMYHAGIGWWRLLFLAFFISAATPAGAVVLYRSLQGISAGTIGILTAFSTGMILYIAATELIPETHRGNRFVNLAFMLAGIGFMIFLLSFAGEGH